MGRYDDLADLMQAVCILVLLCWACACVVAIGCAVADALPPILRWIETGGYMR